ncbi:MAG: hypothetical protein RBR81_10960 [Bacteroidales bacterium]|nr:hypothetical protein [Bacteroidales bacterium]
MGDLSLAHLMLLGIVALVVFPFLMLLVSLVSGKTGPGRTVFSSQKSAARMLCDYIGETHRIGFMKKHNDKKSKGLLVPSLIIVVELLIITFIFWKL